MACLICLPCFICTPAFAKDKKISVTFEYDQTYEQDIDGFKFYERVKAGMVEVYALTDPSAREATFAGSTLSAVEKI